MLLPGQRSLELSVSEIIKASFERHACLPVPVYGVIVKTQRNNYRHTLYMCSLKSPSLNSTWSLNGMYKHTTWNEAAQTLNYRGKI